MTAVPPLQSPLPKRRRSRAQSEALRARRIELEEKRLLAGGATKESKAALAERQRDATLALHTAFGAVLAREVDNIDPQWAIDRYAELGLAACTIGDLGTIRGVLSDLMKHAKDQPPAPSDDDVELLASAVAQLGPEAVELAAKKAGLQIVPAGETLWQGDGELEVAGLPLPPTTWAYRDGVEPPAKPSPGKARMLAALSRTE